MNGGGVVNMLPVGYRFDPTDEDLVVFYLKRKVHGLPLPASIIPDYNSNSYLNHPSHLPMPPAGETMRKRYFFYNSKEDKDQSDNNRGKYKRAAAGCGFWTSIGKEKQIVATTSPDQSSCGQAHQLAVLGVRKTLVFCESPRRKKKTKHHQDYHNQHRNRSLSSTPRWFMHEYHLLGSEVLGNSWVLCCVFQKRRTPTTSKIKDLTSTLHNIGSSGRLPRLSNSLPSEVTTVDREVFSKCFD